jgi:hypothetical protein
MRARLESRLRDGQRPEAGLSVAAADQTTTMKTLFRKIACLFLRGAQMSREHWTQCEFQFPRRLREKAQRRIPS